MSNYHKFTEKSQQLQAFLQDDAQELARETGFVRRESKLTGSHFAQTVVLGWLNNPQAALNELSQVSTELGVSITDVGLHERINCQAVGFLEQLVQRALCRFRERAAMLPEVLAHFTQVNIVDSSIFQLPAFLEPYFRGTKAQGSVSTLKTHLSFEYLSGQCNGLVICEGRSPDQKCALPVQGAQPGSLTLIDLGYFDQTTLQDIDQADGFFVSRLQVQVGLYREVDAPHSLDLLTFLRQQGQSAGEIAVYLGSKTRLPVRLIFVRIPEEIIEERRRKAKAAARRRGKTCSQRHLDLLAWALFITNVPEGRLPAQQVALIYRVRWQVELVFKLWKSQAKMNHIGQWRLERVLCQFYARLLGVIVFQWMVSPYRFGVDRELSLAKAFAVLQRYAVRLLDAIATNWHSMAVILQKIVQDFQQYAQKSNRRKSLSTYQLLMNAGA